MTNARLFFAAAMLACLAVAAAFRLPRLDLRPMHADEANQAVKAGRLYETGEYKYDASDHHGPSLYWLTLPSLALSGAKDLATSSEVDYRIVPALFGIALVGLLLLLTDGLGRPAVAAAALFIAVSPAVVFYSRYFIQETLLVFFTIAAIGCGWRYVRTRRLAWLLAAGAAVGMMHATKETWILSAAAAAGAGGATWVLLKLTAREKSSLTASERTTDNGLLLVAHVTLAALVACAVAVLFFSMFGKNWKAPWDSITAYANYFRRGSQPGEHSEPWYYYLEILFAYRPSKHFFWSEGLIAVLALVGAADTMLGLLKPRSGSTGLRVFLTFYTLLLTILYCAISYKTPWCALNFLAGMILLAGMGVATIFAIISRSASEGRNAFPCTPRLHVGLVFSVPRLRVGLLSLLAAVALAVGTVHLAWQAYRLNFDPRFVADPRNPYVYAHTPMGLPRMTERLDRLRQRMPPGSELTIHVVVKENYWPLPWYLRKFKPDTVHYWLDPERWRDDLEQFPSLCRPSDVVILSADEDLPDSAKGIADRYAGPVMESLRPGVFVRIYVRHDLWPDFIAR